MSKLFATWSFLLIAQTILLAGFILYACSKNHSVTGGNRTYEDK